MNQAKLYAPIIPIRTVLNRRESRDASREYNKAFAVLFPIEKAFGDIVMNADQIAYKDSLNFFSGKFLNAASMLNKLQMQFFKIDTMYFTKQFKAV